MKKRIASAVVILFFVTVCSMTSFAIAGSQVSVARSVRDPFSFSIYVGTDDDNYMTEMALRDTTTFGEGPAYVGFSSLTNASGSLRFKVLKYNPYYNSISGDATNSVLISSNSTSAIYPTYNSTYSSVSGAYKLYAWTTIRDCSAIGNWTP